MVKWEDANVMESVKTRKLPKVTIRSYKLASSAYFSAAAVKRFDLKKSPYIVWGEMEGGKLVFKTTGEEGRKITIRKGFSVFVSVPKALAEKYKGRWIVKEKDGIFYCEKPE